MSPALVSFVRASAAYDQHEVLSDIDLRINPGDFLGIVGPSGCGKTTLLRMLTGSILPRSGRVERREGLVVGYVPQVEHVDWDFPVTVQQCVLMATGRDRCWPWANRAERTAVARVLDQLGLTGLESRHIRELSGGQQQRMFIARALLAEPDLVVLDEPTSGVDLKTRHEVLHMLMDLNRDGLTIVLTTHDLNGIATHLPLTMCLNRTVVAVGPTPEVLQPMVLERTFGAPMQILEHAGMLVIVDDFRGDVVPMRRVS